MFWFLGPEAGGVLAPQPGIQSATPAVEGEVLTTEPPGKPLDAGLFKCYIFCSK